MNVGTQEEIETEDDFEEEDTDKSIWNKIKSLFGVKKWQLKT